MTRFAPPKQRTPGSLRPTMSTLPPYQMCSQHQIPTVPPGNQDRRLSLNCLPRNYPVLQGLVPVITPAIFNIALIPALQVVHIRATTMIILPDSALELAFLVIDFQAPAIILTQSQLVPALLLIDPPALLGKGFGGEN
jgi:hypothetical protein